MTSRPLTLVIAPAGSGKTQLLSNWVAITPAPIAWLSLEETDDDATALWTAVVAALEPLVPGIGGSVRDLLRGNASALDVVAGLLDALEAAAATTQRW